MRALVELPDLSELFISVEYAKIFFFSQSLNSKNKKISHPGGKDKQQTVARKAVINKEKHQTNQNYSHPWLVANLKGHSGRVLDIDLSANGKFLATCSEDGTVLIWPTKHFNLSNKVTLIAVILPIGVRKCIKYLVLTISKEYCNFFRCLFEGILPMTRQIK